MVVVTWAPLGGGVVDGADRDGAPARRRLPVDHHVVPVSRTVQHVFRRSAEHKTCETALNSRLGLAGSQKDSREVHIAAAVDKESAGHAGRDHIPLDPRSAVPTALRVPAVKIDSPGEVAAAQRVGGGAVVAAVLADVHAVRRARADRV